MNDEIKDFTNPFCNKGDETKLREVEILGDKLNTFQNPKEKLKLFGPTPGLIMGKKEVT